MNNKNVKNVINTNLLTYLQLTIILKNKIILL